MGFRGKKVKEKNNWFQSHFFRFQVTALVFQVVFGLWLCKYIASVVLHLLCFFTLSRAAEIKLRSWSHRFSVPILHSPQAPICITTRTQPPSQKVLSNEWGIPKRVPHIYPETWVNLQPPHVHLAAHIAVSWTCHRIGSAHVTIPRSWILPNV